MAARLYSIQGEQHKMPLVYLKCRAFNKHDLDGHIFQEKMGRKNIWVARLECSGCGTQRIDVMKPNTTELISRGYIRPDDYDGKMTSAEARKLLYKHMLESGQSLSTLAG